MAFTGDPDVPVQIVYANQSLERVTGYTNDELLAPNNPLLRVQTQNRALYNKLFQRVRAGEPVHFEVELGPPGRATPMEIRWTPIRYHDGEVTHYVAVLRDIGERRKASAERELLYRAIEMASDFVALYDATPPSRGGPILTYANAAFRHALGYQSSEMLGMSYREFLSGDNDERLLTYIAQMAESSHPMEKEVRVRRKDGSVFWIEFSAHPVHTDDLREHWFVVGRDITARRRAVEERATLVRVVDALPIPVEIYGSEEGRVSLVFQNEIAARRAPAGGREEALRFLEEGRTEAVLGEHGMTLIPLFDHEGLVDTILRIAVE